MAILDPRLSLFSEVRKRVLSSRQRTFRTVRRENLYTEAIKVVSKKTLFAAGCFRNGGFRERLGGSRKMAVRL